MKTTIFLLLISFSFFSCSDKYQAFKKQYNYKNVDGNPDYKDLNYWASHPWKWDPADSIPKPLRSEQRDSSVDVFFIHPTMFVLKKYHKKWNADIDDYYINAKTDYSTILFQASAFNQHARIFAPRYREAHINSFFTKDTASANKAFEIAYQDVKTAFEYYLKTWNHNRPIIIASHSQGTKHAERLLKEFFENKPLNNQLVVAYLLGWPVPKDYFGSLKMCADSVETNCLCGWRTFRKNYVPSYLKKENGNSFATNPLNWKTDETYADKYANKGGVLTKFNKVYKNTNDARIRNGLLWVRKPKFPWSFLFVTRNYHIGDYNLFYINVRENVEQRINAYLSKHSSK
ncbi:MAG: DUF3089 domain-containing protein [Parafilimonas sp.]